MADDVGGGERGEADPRDARQDPLGLGEAGGHALGQANLTVHLNYRRCQISDVRVGRPTATH